MMLDSLKKGRHHDLECYPGPPRSQTLGEKFAAPGTSTNVDGITRARSELEGMLTKTPRNEGNFIAALIDRRKGQWSTLTIRFQQHQSDYQHAKASTHLIVIIDCRPRDIVVDAGS